jgi:hypothetical protein
MKRKVHKVILHYSFLLFPFFGSTQIGVLTLDSTDEVYYGQWYTLTGKEYKNQVYFYDKKEIVDSLVLELIKPWSLTLKDGKLDEEGDLYWFLDNGNGFDATVYITKKGDDSVITILTTEATIEEK